MALNIVSLPGGFKMFEDKLLVKCSPHFRCSCKIGILNGSAVEFWRFATDVETWYYAK